MAGDACHFCFRSDYTHHHAGLRFEAYCGRAQRVLQHLPENSIQMVLTDPPYGSGATGTIARSRASTSEKYTNRKNNSLPEFHGDSVLPDKWRRDTEAVFFECHRVLEPGGYALAFSDWRALTSMLDMLGDIGFCIASVCVWDKGRATRPTQNGFRAQSEFIICAKKPGKQLREPVVYLDGVFRHPVVPGASRRHLVEKPVELLAQLVEACPPGGTVLDPYQGAGSTGVATIKSGRRYIGVESVEHYHRVAVERLTEAEAGTIP